MDLFMLAIFRHLVVVPVSSRNSFMVCTVAVLELSVTDSEFYLSVWVTSFVLPDSRSFAQDVRRFMYPNIDRWILTVLTSAHRSHTNSSWNTLKQWSYRPRSITMSQRYSDLELLVRKAQSTLTLRKDQSSMLTRWTICLITRFVMVILIWDPHSEVETQVVRLQLQLSILPEIIINRQRISKLATTTITMVNCRYLNLTLTRCYQTKSVLRVLVSLLHLPSKKISNPRSLLKEKRTRRIKRKSD